MTAEMLRFGLSGVTAYRNILALPLMEQVIGLLDALSRGKGALALERYAQIFYDLRAGGYQGLGDWLWDALRYEEGPYPRLVERGQRDPALENAAMRDIGTFAILAQTNGDKLVERIKELLPVELDAVAANLPRWRSEVPFSFEKLTAFYRENGAGLFARYRAFHWGEGGLTPVAEPDCFDSGELLGYRQEREAVEANTRAMLEGCRVNNVLLYGEPGTGKSATVKSLLTVPGFGDLRLIEVDKAALTALPGLIRTLGGRRQKFILFIDDLSFDQDDRTYSALKSILEGGLERRPANVAVYATSNRRHLVRQTFSDREGDEVDRTETINEKTSLAERFGLRVLFQSLNKRAFLDMVEGLAKLHGVEMDREALLAGAVRFEVRYQGKTPRTAQQYIASLRV